MNKNTDARNNLWIIVGIFACFISYVFITVRYAVDIPLTDDYYDAIYFIYSFGNSETISQKIALIFWQYDEYNTVLNRIIYLIYYGIVGNLNFKHFIYLGNIYFFSYIALFYCLFPRQQRNAYTLLIIVLCVLNLYHYQIIFWAQASMIFYSNLFLTALIFKLLTVKNNLFATLIAGLLFWLAAFSHGNGVFLLPLGALCLFLAKQNNSSFRQQLAIWLLLSTCGTIVFFTYLQTIFETSITETALTGILSQPFNILLSLIILIGNLPLHYGEPIYLSIVFGTVIVGCIIYLTYHFLFKPPLRKYYAPAVICLFLFCSISLVASTLIRVPLEGIIATYTSRYKIYTGSLLAITALILYYSAHDHHKLKFKYASLAICISLFVFSFYACLPYIVKMHDEKQTRATQWSLHGTHASLGIVAWYPLSSTILHRSIDTDIYSPLAQENIPTLVTPISIDQCPSDNIPLAEPIRVTATHNNPAVAAKITFLDRGLNINQVYLCGSSENFLLTLSSDNVIDQDSQKNKLILDLAAVATGDYKIYLAAVDKLYPGNKALTIHQRQINYHCPENIMMIAARKVMAENICNTLTSPIEHPSYERPTIEINLLE